MTSRLRAICALLVALATVSCFAASGLAGPRCAMELAASTAPERNGCGHCAPESMQTCVAQCLVVDPRGEVLFDPPTEIGLDVPPLVELSVVGLATEPCTPPPRSNFG